MRRRVVGYIADLSGAFYALYGSRRFVIEYQLPMKRTLLAIGVAVLVSMMLASAQPTPQQSQQAKALAIYAPRPNYPKDAQAGHPTGSGIVLMEVDKKTGLVKSTRMEKSTGNKPAGCGTWKCVRLSTSPSIKVAHMML